MPEGWNTFACPRFSKAEVCTSGYVLHTGLSDTVLQVARTAQCLSDGCLNITASPTLQHTDAGARRSIGKLLGSFGNHWPTPTPAEGLLVAANLDFFTLAVVAKLQLEFVDDISSHLILNPVTRKLRIFAHPAIAAFWCDPARDHASMLGNW